MTLYRNHGAPGVRILERENDELRAALAAKDEEIKLQALRAETFERQYRQCCQDHAGVMAIVHKLRAELAKMREALEATIERLSDAQSGYISGSTSDCAWKEGRDFLVANARATLLCKAYRGLSCV